MPVRLITTDPDVLAHVDGLAHVDVLAQVGLATRARAELPGVRCLSPNIRCMSIGGRHG